MTLQLSLAALFAAVEGDLRLADRIDVNGYATGALQVYLNGAWGAVCGNRFGRVDASVACRQLGFIDGTTLPLAVLSPLTSISERDRIEIQVISTKSLHVPVAMSAFC